MDYSKIPIDLSKVAQEDLDKEMLRASIWVELDTINLYEQFISMTQDENLRKVFEDVNKEEKTHTAEFLHLLLHLDPEQVKELRSARTEVEKLTGLDIPEG